MATDQRGIAYGEPGVPEEEGIFVSHDEHIDDARFFVRMGRGRRVDVWAVDVTGLELEPGPDGWFVCRTPIEPSRLRLAEVWDTDGGFGEPRVVTGEADPLTSRRKAKRQGRR